MIFVLKMLFVITTHYSLLITNYSKYFLWLKALSLVAKISILASGLLVLRNLINIFVRNLDISVGIATLESVMYESVNKSRPTNFSFKNQCLRTLDELKLNVYATNLDTLIRITTSIVYNRGVYYSEKSVRRFLGV